MKRILSDDEMDLSEVMDELDGLGDASPDENQIQYGRQTITEIEEEYGCAGSKLDFKPTEHQILLRSMYESEEYQDTEDQRNITNAASERLRREDRILFKNGEISGPRPETVRAGVAAQKASAALWDMILAVEINPEAIVSFPEIVKQNQGADGIKVSMRDFLLWRVQVIKDKYPQAAENYEKLAERFYPRSDVDDDWDEYTESWTNAQRVDHDEANDWIAAVDDGRWP